VQSQDIFDGMVFGVCFLNRCVSLSAGHQQPGDVIFQKTKFRRGVCEPLCGSVAETWGSMMAFGWRLRMLAVWDAEKSRK